MPFLYKYKVSLNQSNKTTQNKMFTITKDNVTYGFDTEQQMYTFIHYYIYPDDDENAESKKKLEEARTLNKKYSMAMKKCDGGCSCNRR